MGLIKTLCESVCGLNSTRTGYTSVVVVVVVVVGWECRHMNCSSYSCLTASHLQRLMLMGLRSGLHLIHKRKRLNYVLCQTSAVAHKKDKTRRQTSKSSNNIMLITPGRWKLSRL